MAEAKKDVWKGPESPPYKVINYDKEIQNREKMVVFLSKKLEKADATGAAAKSDEIEINGKLFKKSYVKDKLHILNYDIQELRSNIRNYDATLDFSEIKKITDVNKLRTILQNAGRHTESYPSSIIVLRKNVENLMKANQKYYKDRIKFVLSRPVRQMEHADFWLAVEDEMNSKKGGKRKTRRRKRKKRKKKKKRKSKKKRGGRKVHLFLSEINNRLRDVEHGYGNDIASNANDIAANKAAIDDIVNDINDLFEHSNNNSENIDIIKSFINHKGFPSRNSDGRTTMQLWERHLNSQIRRGENTRELRDAGMRGGGGSGRKPVNIETKEGERYIPPAPQGNYDQQGCLEGTPPTGIITNWNAGFNNRNCSTIGPLQIFPSQHRNEDHSLTIDECKCLRDKNTKERVDLNGRRYDGYHSTNLNHPQGMNSQLNLAQKDVIVNRGNIYKHFPLRPYQIKSMKSDHPWRVEMKEEEKKNRNLCEKIKDGVCVVQGGMKKRKSRKKKRKGGKRKKGLSKNKYKRSYQIELFKRIQQARQQQAQENKMPIMPGTGGTPTVPKNKPSGTGGTGGRKTRRKHK